MPQSGIMSRKKPLPEVEQGEKLRDRPANRKNKKDACRKHWRAAQASSRPSGDDLV